MSTRVVCAAVSALLVIAGCAEGTGDSDTGAMGDTGLTDTGPVDTGPMDTGSPDSSEFMDTGTPPPTCDDDDYGDTCEAATDLGSFMEGETMSPTPGSITTAGGEDWYRMDFPPNPEMNTPGGGTPTVEFSVNEGDAFRLEVLDTCTTPLSCSEGMTATDVTAWSFVDDQSLEGLEQWTTRDVPWPASVLVRVYRPTGAPDCQRYRLSISR